MSLSVPARTGSLAHRLDALLLAGAAAHGALLVLSPSAPLVALLLWWNANTISHNFIHNPFFRARRANAAFSGVLSLLLGFPQALWKARHVAHHAGRRPNLRRARGLRRETVLVAALWTVLLLGTPHTALTVFAPGVLLGLALCWLQGHYEHARGTTGHYGRLYNALFFNDGFHPEHHDAPGVHWSELPVRRSRASRTSRWPAVLRWLESHPLDLLEWVVLHQPWLQRRVLACHERALLTLLPHMPPIRRALIVGGGLFPRTAILLRRHLPQAELVIVDHSAGSLRAAAALLPAGVDVRCDEYRGGDAVDLVVLPLAYAGDREALCCNLRAPALLVHDWLWRRRGRSVVVSWLLLKRLALVTR